jgi:hypothetical protein
MVCYDMFRHDYQGINPFYELCFVAILPAFLVLRLFFQKALKFHVLLCDQFFVPRSCEGI